MPTPQPQINAQSAKLTPTHKFPSPLKGELEESKNTRLLHKYHNLCEKHNLNPHPIAEGTYIRMYGGTAPDPTDDMYRAIPAYSNSRLGQIKNRLQGIIKNTLPYEAFEFGKIFHQQVLERHLCPLDAYYLTPAKLRDLKGMIAAIHDSKFAFLLDIESTTSTSRNLIGVKYEAIHLWTDRITKAICKAKMDIETNHFVYDLKTTRAHNQAAFEAAAKLYDYDRQAAFYLDGSKAQGFTLIGVQKQKPYNIYEINYTPRMKRIDRARKRYRFILKKAIGEGIST